MPRPCTVCQHPDRDAIDRALVAGEPAASVAARYRTESPPLGRMAVQRHKAEHLPAALALAQDAQEAANADDLLAQLRGLQERTLALLDKAEQAGKLGTAVMAVKEARGNLELLAKLLGDLDERPQVNLLIAPEWLALRERILAALAPYPDARLALAEALGA